MYVRLAPFSRRQDHPIRNWAEHSREIFSLDWNNIQKELFASSSWDGTVKVVRVLRMGVLPPVEP